eukprot:4177666-Pleurochrysis_carterae.AAC.1
MWPAATCLAAVAHALPEPCAPAKPFASRLSARRLAVRFDPRRTKEGLFEQFGRRLWVWCEPPEMASSGAEGQWLETTFSASTWPMESS